MRDPSALLSRLPLPRTETWWRLAIGAVGVAAVALIAASCATHGIAAPRTTSERLTLP